MYLCYLDESGTTEISGNTTHFVLLGFAIPADVWLDKDQRINKIKANYSLQDSEIHTGFLARRFPEQEKIKGFAEMDWPERRAAVLQGREQHLIKTVALSSDKKLKEIKKVYKKTEDYTHLTFEERWKVINEIAIEVAGWRDVRLFAEAIDKNHLGNGNIVYKQAFEQVVARFHTFLTIMENDRARREQIESVRNYGVLIQDKNQTVEMHLTELMRRFHREGTLWAKIPRIIETPLFVDSKLTSMVQIADLCAYATRRYFENNETALFGKIAGRFDKKNGRMVGIRHFSDRNCGCLVCRRH